MNNTNKQSDTNIDENKILSNNLVIIDPNNEGDHDGYLDVTKLNIDVRLETIRKESSTIIATNDDINISGRISNKVDFLSGTSFNSNNEKTLSTIFTEVGNNYGKFTDDNGIYRNLETLGITEVNIDFNSSNIPVVTMNMVDVRGLLFQQGNDSPYSMFFEFPYPIFRLTVKGYLGKAVSYDLHMTNFESTFNSDYGGFEIKCNFIGYKYAFLSDMLIGYLRGVVYTNFGSEILKNMSSAGGVTFEDYNENVLKYKNIISEYNKDDIQQKIYGAEQAIESLINLETSIRNYFKTRVFDRYITNVINQTDTTLITFVPNTTDLSGGYLNTSSFITDSDKTEILKFISGRIKTYNSLNTSFPIDNDPDNYRIFSNQDCNIQISEIDGTKMVTNGYYHQDSGMGTPMGELVYYDKSNIPIVTRPIGRHKVRTITFDLLLRKLNEKIYTISNQHESDKVTAAAGYEKLMKDEGIDMSIGYYMNILCNHVDVLMESIEAVANLANNDIERNNQFVGSNINGIQSYDGKIYAFPEYKEYDAQLGGEVEKWIGNIQSENNKIPEVEFVEQLLQGVLKAKLESDEVLDYINTPINERKINFTPIHPIDSELFYQPYKGVIQTKHIDDIRNMLFYRFSMFLMTQNKYNDIGLNRIDLNRYSENILKDFIEIEVKNLMVSLGKNNNAFNELIMNIKGSGVFLMNGDSKIYSSQTLDVIDGVTSEGEPIYKKVDLIKSTKMTNDVYYRKFDGVGENTHVVNNNNDDYVYSINYKTTGDGFEDIELFGGMNKSELIKNNNSIDIITSSDYTKMNILDNKVLSTDDNYDNRTILGAKFSELYGFPYINSYDGKDTSLAFYKGGILPDVNNIGYYSENKFNRVFSSSLYRFQDTIEDKAMVFLYSIPFDINSGVNNMTKNLSSLFKYRTGIVKSSFLWCALIGGIFKSIKGDVKLKVSETTDPSGRLVFTKDDYTNTLGGKRYWKYKSGNSINLPYNIKELNNLVLSDNFKHVMEFDYDEMEVMKFGQMFSLFSQKMINKFISMFDDFVRKFNIIDFETVIFNDKMDTIIKTNNELKYDEQVNLKMLKDNIFKKITTGDTIFKNKEILKKGNQTNFYVSSSDVELRRPVIDGVNVGQYNIINPSINKGSGLDESINDLLKEIVFIVNKNANLWDSKNNFYDMGTQTNPRFNAYLYRDDMVKLDTLLINKLREYNDDLTNNFEINNDSELHNVYGTTSSDELKLKVYKDIKNIYDKWMSGDSSYKNGDNTSLFNTFKFVNRTYQDISKTFQINLFKVTQDLMGNFNQPLYGHISRLLADNNFNFLPMPAYIDLSSGVEVLDMFKPRYFDEVKGEGILKPMFVCMFVGEMSSKLDLGDRTRYRSDGISMTRVDGKLAQPTANDFNSSNALPIIVARYGDDKQSIFKNISISQSEYSLTNESLVNTEDITNSNGVGQNLFDIYSSRSYTVTITTLGNSTIQPFMYLYLEGVPMYYGLYYVIKVKHNIRANGMETTITAVRMRNTITPMVDVKAIYHSLFVSVVGSRRYSSGQSDTTRNVTNKGEVRQLEDSRDYYLKGQGKTFRRTSPYPSFINYEIMNTSGIVVKERSTNVERFCLPEVRDFIVDVGARWSEYSKDTNLVSELSINATTKQFGGSTEVHKSHKIGTSIDIRQVNTQDGNFSYSGTDKLLEIISEVAKEEKYTKLYDNQSVIYVAYFNNQNLINKYGFVQKMQGHDSHIHLEIRVPDKYLKWSEEGGYNIETSEDALVMSEDVGFGDKIEQTTNAIIPTQIEGYFKHTGKVTNDSEYPYMTAEVKALLDVISYTEGTLGRGNNEGYDILFGSVSKKLLVINGYNKDNTNIQHRGEKGVGNWATSFTQNGKKVSTGASGRYQFLFGTWKGVNANVMNRYEGLKVTDKSNETNRDFSKRNQDLAGGCLVYDAVLGKDLNKIINVNQTGLINILKSKKAVNQWASLGNIGTTKTLSENNIFRLYENALNKYL